ncbi:MAG: type 4a pilus biogenesis protein PilO [Armatimonadetes bacterium]|nr:type 4a pilus biogenesis protein PilO [Armatimonadota bacterium]
MKPENPAKTIALMALGVIAIGGGLVYWQYSVHGDAEAHLNKMRAETPDEAKLEKQLQDAQAELYKASTNLKHLEGGVPTLAYVPTLLQELESAGKSQNLQVTVFKQAQTPTAQPASTTGGDAKSLKDKPYDEVEFDVSGRGNYKSVGDMLAALQSFPKIVSVQSIGITPKRDPANPTAATVEATLHVKAFMFKQAEDPTAKKDLQANNVKGGAQ